MMIQYDYLVRFAVFMLRYWAQNIVLQYMSEVQIPEKFNSC